MSFSQESNQVKIPTSNRIPDYLKEGFQLCDTSTNHVLELRNFLELCIALHIPQSQETKCIELYRQVNTMDFTTFHQLFDTTLHTMQLTNLTNTDLLALHPDFLRRVMSQALVDIQPEGTSRTPEIALKMNRLGLVMRIYTRENQRLRDSVQRITNETKQFRLQVENEYRLRPPSSLITKSTPSTPSTPTTPTTPSTTSSAFHSNSEKGSIGPKVAAELHRHIHAQELELTAKQECIDQLQHEKIKAYNDQNEQNKLVQLSHDTSIQKLHNENVGLRRHVEELEHSNAEIEKSLLQESQERESKENEISQLKNQNVVRLEAMEDKLEIEKRNYENIRNGLEKEVITLRSHCDELSMTVEHQKELLMEQSNLLETTDADRKNSNVEVESLNKSIYLLRNEMKTKEEFILDTKNMNNQLVLEVDELNAQNEHLNDEKINLLNSSNANETKIDLLQEEIKHFKKNIIQYQNTNNEMKNEKNILQNKKELQEKEFNALTIKNRTVLNELMVLKREKQKLEDEMKLKNDINNRNIQNITSLENDLLHLQQLNTDYRTEQKEKIQQEIRKEQQKSSFGTTIDGQPTNTIILAHQEENNILRERMNVEMKRSNTLNQTNKTSILNLKNKINELNSQIDEITTSYQHDQRKHVADTLLHKDEKEKYEAALHVQKMNISKLESKQQAMQEECQSFKMKSESFSNAIQNVKIEKLSQLKLLTEEIAELKKNANEQETKAHQHIVSLQRRLKNTESALEKTIRQLQDNENNYKLQTTSIKHLYEEKEKENVSIVEELKRNHQVTIHSIKEKNRQQINTIETMNSNKQNDTFETNQQEMKKLQTNVHNQLASLETERKEIQKELHTTLKLLRNEKDERNREQYNASRSISEAVLASEDKLKKQHMLQMHELRNAKLHADEIYNKHKIESNSTTITLKNKIQELESTIHRLKKTKVELEEMLKDKENETKNMYLTHKQHRMEWEEKDRQNRTAIDTLEHNTYQLEQKNIYSKATIEKLNISNTTCLQNEQELKDHIKEWKSTNNKITLKLKDDYELLNDQYINLKDKQQRLDQKYALEQNNYSKISILYEEERNKKKELAFDVEQMKNILQNKIEIISKLETTTKDLNLQRKKDLVHINEINLLHEQKTNELSEKYLNKKIKMNELKNICREEIASLSVLLTNGESKRNQLEQLILNEKQKYILLEKEMNVKADEIIEIEMSSKEREQKMKNDLLFRQKEEESLKTTHLEIENRLAQSTQRMYDLVTKLNIEKEKSTTLELNHSNLLYKMNQMQQNHEIKIQNLQNVLKQEKEKRKDIHTDLEQRIVTDAKQAEEIILTLRQEMSQKSNQCIQLQSKLIEIENTNHSNLSIINVSKQKISSLESVIHQTTTSTANQRNNDEAMNMILSEKKSLELQITTLEATISIHNETEKRLKKKNEMLLNDINIIQLDLKNRIHTIEEHKKSKWIIEDLKNQLIQQDNATTKMKLEYMTTIEAEEGLRKKERSTVESLLSKQTEIRNELNIERLNSNNKNQEINTLTNELNKIKQIQMTGVSKNNELINGLKNKLKNEQEEKLQIQRKLNMMNNELDLETSMRSELNGIRNDFRSFLNQSKQVVSPDNHSSSEHYQRTMDHHTESEYHASSKPSPRIIHTTSASNASPGRMSTSNSSENNVVFSTSNYSNHSNNYGMETNEIFNGHSTRELLSLSPLNNNNNNENEENNEEEDGETTVAISRRGSIRVHAPPRRD